MTFTSSVLQPGVQYQIVVYPYNSFYFRHFSDGDLNRYELVTLNTSQPHATFEAQYQYVPPSQLATLNVIADTTERNADRYDDQQQQLHTAHPRIVVDGRTSRDGAVHRDIDWR